LGGSGEGAKKNVGQKIPLVKGLEEYPKNKIKKLKFLMHFFCNNGIIMQREMEIQNSILIIAFSKGAVS
jgi:hypothetical protein